jgi:phage shock protein C
MNANPNTDLNTDLNPNLTPYPNPDLNSNQNPNMTAKLYRSESNRIVAGVCGGLARYLNIDVTLVRLFFILLALAGGSGVLLYIIMSIVMPSDGQVAPGAITTAGSGNNQGAIVIGGALLVLGIFFLVQTTIGAWIPWLGFRTLWPLLLILAGGAVLWNRAKGGQR